MKVVKNNDDDNNNNQPLTPAELEAIRQFEASERDGQAVFHPQVAAGQPVPSCVPLLEEIGRFAITILEGRHSIENSQWWRHEANGIQTPVDNPLEQAWQAARAVRGEIKRKLNFNPYAIAVVWFPDMEEDEDILDEAGGRSVHLCFGQVDLVERLVSLPKGDELQTQLSAHYIKREVAALSRSPGAKAEPEPAEGPRPVSGRAGALIFHGGVGTVNIYITIVNGDDDDAPPLITVQGE